MKSSHSSTSSSRTSAIPAQGSVSSTATTQSTSTSTTVTSSSSALLPSSSKLVSETLDFIKKGDEIIEGQKTKENIIIVLGPTGAGKGTLINYLSGTALKPVYQDGTWKLSAEKTLPDISISHSRQSDTFYPAIHSPEGKNFSYIDSPGFGDSRGVAHDIATAYFRQKIMEMQEIKSMKVLIALPYKDFSAGRGDIVKGYINALDQFLQLNKNAKHIEELKQAIAPVITQVDSPRFSIEKLKAELNAKRENANKVLSDVPEGSRAGIIDQLLASDIQKFNESLQEVSNTSAERKGTIAKAFKEQGGMEPGAEKVFDHLAQDSNFEIFSKPIIVSQKKAVMVSGEREQILRLIDKSRYIEKSKIEIGITISSDTTKVVIHLAKNINDTIGEEVRKAVVEIINACKQKIGESQEFDPLKAYLSSKLWIMESVITSTDSKTFNPQVFSESVDGKFTNAQEIKKYVGYIDFFKKLDSNIGYEAENWNRAFKDLHKQIEYLLTPQKPEIQNNVLTIKGSLLSLKDHLKLNQYAKAIKIYATNKVFLDKDLQLKGVSLAIIAPDYEVGNKRVIDLSGKEGANYAFKAENGLAIKAGMVDRYGSGIEGNHGVNGKPGNPGGSAGNFLGVGKGYNLNHLTINVSGGDGGRGQDGGDGSDGSNGLGGNGAMVEARHTIVRQSREQLAFADKEGVGNKIFHGVKKVGTFNSQFLETYESRGMDGGKGGDAGMGGNGGNGGLSGEILMLDKGWKGVSNKGGKGADGDSGKFGIGGHNGSTWSGKYVSEEVLPALRGGGGGGGVSAAGSAVSIAAIQTGVVTSAEIAAQETAKAIFKQAAREAIIENMKSMLKNGAATTTKVVTETLLSEITKQVGKETMRAVGNEAAKEIGKEVTKTILAEAAVGQAIINGATWTWTPKVIEKIASNIGAEVATTTVTQSYLATAAGIATSMGTSLAAQAVLSVGSAYLSSDWIEKPQETERGRADDGTKPNTKNSAGLQSSLVSHKFTYKEIEEFKEYYRQETENPFVDQGVLDELAGIGMELPGNDL